MVHVSGPSLEQLDDRGDRFAADIRRAIAAIVDDVVPTIKSIDDLAIIRTRWTEVANASLSRHLLDAWLNSADDTYGKLVRASQRVAQTQGGQSQTAALTAAFLVPKVVSRLAELFLESAINRLVAIGDFVWNTARAQMLMGMQAGESISDIRDRLMETTTLATPRAEVIARTEVIGASNAGSYAEMKATGFNATKEWIATEDSRTRPSHEHVDGKEVGIDDKFIVGGYAMSYPHDPSGPPQEVISCRCTLGWDIPEEEFLTIDDEPLAAAAVFHLLGKHDQHSHGRRGARSVLGGSIAPGKNIKMTHGLVHKKHPEGTTIAVNKSGDKKVTWNGKSYNLDKKQSDGSWKTEKTAIKSKAYKEVNDFDSSWHEPVAGNDDTKLPSTKTAPTPTPMPTPNKSSAPAAASKTDVAGTVTKTTPVPMENELIEADKPLKITDSLFERPKEYSTLAITKDGKYRVVSLNGTYFEVQENKKVGGWGPLASFDNGDDFNDIVALDKEWYTPKLKTSESKTVPTSSPMTAGVPIDITQDMFNDFPTESVLAINEDGTKRIARSWNGIVVVQQWKPEFGVWTGIIWPTDGEEASEVSKLNIKWHAPVATGSGPTTPPVPKPGKIIGKDDAVKPGKPIALTQELIDQDHPSNSIIAVAPDGNKKLTWTGTEYQVLELDTAEDKWFVSGVAPKDKAVDMANYFSSDWNEPVAPSASTTPAPSVSKSFTPFQKAYVNSIFGSNGVKWHTDTKKIYDSALEVSQKDPSLTMADALAIMDQSLQKKTGDPFSTKMTKFLSTKAGMKYAQEKGGSAPVGSTTSTVPATPSAPKPSVDIPKSNGPAKNLSKAESTAMQSRMDAISPPPWTNAQRMALRNYTGGSYTEINKCARGTGACTPATLNKIKQIKAAMKPSTQNIKLYRKTNLATFGVKNNAELEALVGNTIRDDGVISTSIKEGTWSGQVHLKIEAPAGSKMAWVQPISYYPNENEMILAPGTEFEVISVTPHYSYPEQRVMVVRIVPGSGA